MSGEDHVVTHYRGETLDFGHCSLERVAAIARRYGLRVSDIAQGRVSREPSLTVDSYGSTFHGAASPHGIEWTITPPPEDRMPTTTQPAELPPDNPYRQPDRRVADYASTPGDADGGFSIADLNALLARHEAIARNAAIVEMRGPNRDALASTYDLAWQRGMEEQHRRTSGAFANRVHALLEVVHLLPQLSAPSAVPMLLNVMETVELVLDAIASEHEAGAFALLTDEADIPDRPMPVADLASPQEVEDAIRTRALQLVEWLRVHVPEQSPVPEDADTIGEPENVERVRLRYQRGNGER
jgi:hypothetical protein